MELHTDVARSGGVRASTNKLRLGTFGTNDESYGMWKPNVPLQPEDQWPGTIWAAKEADRMGLEAIVPVSTWPANSFDTMAFAAAVGAVTEQATVFATVDMGVTHPVLAAKQLASIDHITRGRLAVNVVAGWRQQLVEAFGQELLEHDDRYDRASEWMQIAQILWTGALDEEVEFNGEYYKAKLAKGAAQPKPLQRPWPLIMNAGTSERAGRFNAEYADMAFLAATQLEEKEAARETIRAFKALAEEQGRSIQVWASSPVVARDTVKEADDYLAEIEADRLARRPREEREEELERMRATSGTYRHLDEEGWRKLRESPYMTYGGRTLGLHGTPEHVVERLQGLSDAGLDGVIFILPDFAEDLPYFEHNVLPLLEQSGLRNPHAPA